MSEQQAEAIQGESGSVGGGSTVSPSSVPPSEAAAALAMSVLGSSGAGPEHEASKADSGKPEPASPDAPPPLGKVLIMSPGDRTWHDHTAGAEVKTEARSAGRPDRSLLATAAMLALAVVAGAIGGALATTGLIRVADAASPPPNSALEASIGRIDAEIGALRADLDHTTKGGLTQFNKTAERLDRLEKAQAEPAAKLAKLTEAVEKLRSAASAAAVPAPAPATPKEVTGSVTPQAVAAATPSVPVASHAAETPTKPEVGRLPTVEGWSLREVGYGGALIQGRRGTFEVYPGDYISGLGRIDAVRKQDGQWVVVTSKGLVVRQ